MPSKSKNKKKSVTKSGSKKPTTRSTDMSETTKSESADIKNLFYGTMSAIATYVFASWAIDSGSLWVYALMFASVYYTGHFYRLFIKYKFFNNDKTAKARSAKN
jgi:hypothetical protein